MPMCEDIDECIGDPCDANVGMCENTDGSFICTCPDGYSLQTDMSSCEGMTV